ncbi:D-alanyl-D-alanine carboxypeptidase family protein [Lachnoclostridium sp. Marseille-P6806]|uniref:D-alanyl-D-alanine carboxypeptidase family protein n=1 Tax=Lachnoclostridium sp. Marseille-P6806 TaxID=2364793 RepID=UPI001F5E7910|nr:serine hydrolase [Lachnoclostridium sp. Marseille-P6806]
MRFTNKSLAAALLAAGLMLTGCGEHYSMPYGENLSDSSYGIAAQPVETSDKAVPFASKLCVTEVDGAVGGSGSVDLAGAGAAAVFDVKNKEVLFSTDIYTRHYPASMTKIMTALVALNNGSPDMVLTASDSIYTLGADAQTCGIQSGDTMTLDQALHLLLVYSANDAAIMIAEGIGGSMEGFTQMMNAEAASLGATATNFVNSNGLSDSNHYTTAYDMYLIFNAAIRNEKIKEIIHMATYSTVYHDRNGADKEVEVKSTDSYLTGNVSAPSGVTVIGGKTGTTDAAGHCLVLLSNNTSGSPYISIVMQAPTTDALYSAMNSLLSEIPN